jgi:osmoprotectant transport system substrate-binding protein
MKRLWLVAVVLALGCGGSGDRVVVGSKNFTEQRILGELLAQTLEANGLAVERRLDLGGTFVCDAALRNGQIDTYVEYTGTALTAVLKEEPATDPADVLARVRKGYAPAGLVWTAPLGFDNTFALVVRGDAGPTTISAAVAPARSWKAGFGYEFQQRADGYPMLQRIYGLEFAEVRTLDLGLLYRALIDRQVDLVVGSATDGLIEAQHLTMLADDRHAFPPYEAVPIVRQATLDRWPAVKTALDSLGGTLTAATMRRLNHEVDGGHRSPSDVVRAWRQAPAATK